MALIFKFDSDQLQVLIDSINNLSNNLAKWQAGQTVAIEEGFTDLVNTLGGTRSEDAQARINELTSTVKAVKDKLQTSVNNQNKGD